ncbi:hypothetical protein FA13DRAFT_482668 [Coprinellus micaceus]|uniref:Uncharacterized protein n=1 Tax=Coprinellus micaceus TaxID=71717 RepID=A0A4Y7TAI5_COPMI|nr:hypothetical protein FA13DRAFT_482668 [Coprinellus micaceus]
MLRPNRSQPDAHTLSTHPLGVLCIRISPEPRRLNAEYSTGVAPAPPHLSRRAPLSYIYLPHRRSSLQIQCQPFACLHPSSSDLECYVQPWPSSATPPRERPPESNVLPSRVSSAETERLVLTGDAPRVGHRQTCPATRQRRLTLRRRHRVELWVPILSLWSRRS